MIAHWGTTVVDAEDPGDRRLLSVTSVIGNQGESDGLIWWARRAVAELAIDRQSQWLPHVHAGDRKAAVDFLAKAHQVEADAARDLGSQVHDLLERWVLDGYRPDAPDEAAPYLDQFGRWLDRADPTYEAVELTVFNLTYGYAGTLDGVATIGGVRFLVDYKTSAKAYDTQQRPTKPRADGCGLQLAAYAHAERAAAFRARRVEAPFSPRVYALSDAELAQAVDMPEVDAGLIIHITPEHCTAYPFSLGRPAFRAFLHAVEMYRWAKQTSKAVMGPPLDLGGVARGHHRAATSAA